MRFKIGDRVRCLDYVLAEYPDGITGTVERVDVWDRAQPYGVRCDDDFDWDRLAWPQADRVVGEGERHE